MEKRDAVVYLYFGILILGALLAIYFFNLQLTGFAIQQDNQTSFDEGTYNNIFYDTNSTAIVLNASQTNGTYISKIFGNGSEVQWNNLTWTGNVPTNASFFLSIAGCETENCSDATFNTIENISYNGSGTFPHNDLNITKPYFQYIIVFERNNESDESPKVTSVSIDYSPVESSPPIVTSVSLSEPTGTKPSGAEIPLNFTFIGENITCWYNIVDSDDENKALITAGNVTLDNCNNITNLGVGRGSFILYIYVNGSSGFASSSSSFSVTNPTKSKDTSAAKEEDEEESIIEETTITELTLQTIENPTISPSGSQNINLIVKNTGNVAVGSCKLNAVGDFVSWLSVPTDNQIISPGEEKNFAFSITVPENTADGNYAFTMHLQCARISRDSSFSVNVERKKMEFNITKVERTRANRVVVTYSLKELLSEKQTAQLQFFLYDSANKQIANVSQNQTLSANQSKEFSTNIPINASLESNMTMTLSANLNSEQYSVSVRKPITLGAPTGFFVFGDDMGTTGNVLAIVILIVGGIAVFFFVKRRKISKKFNQQ